MFGCRVPCLAAGYRVWLQGTVFGCRVSCLIAKYMFGCRIPGLAAVYHVWLQGTMFGCRITCLAARNAESKMKWGYHANIVNVYGCYTPHTHTLPLQPQYWPIACPHYINYPWSSGSKPCYDLTLFISRSHRLRDQMLCLAAGSVLACSIPCSAAGCLESMMERGNHADIVSFDRLCRHITQMLVCLGAMSPETINQIKIPQLKFSTPEPSSVNFRKVNFVLVNLYASFMSTRHRG